MSKQGSVSPDGMFRLPKAHARARAAIAHVTLALGVTLCAVAVSPAAEFDIEGRYEYIDPPQSTAYPGMVEVIDVFWAPLSALLVFQLYGSSLLSGVALVEEILPFTDIFPTATVGWILQNTVVCRLPCPWISLVSSPTLIRLTGYRSEAGNENPSETSPAQPALQTGIGGIRVQHMPRCPHASRLSALTAAVIREYFCRAHSRLCAPNHESEPGISLHKTHICY